MKNKNIIALAASFVMTVVIFIILAMITIPKGYRLQHGFNPMRTIEGISNTIERFIHLNPTVNYLLTILLVLVIWWRIYALIKKAITSSKKKDNEVTI